MNDFEKTINTLTNAADDNPVAEQADAIFWAISVLQQLDQWCDAYPEDIFIPMTKKDWKDHHTILENADRSGSAAAADCMRHVVRGFKKVLHE